MDHNIYAFGSVVTHTVPFGNVWIFPYYVKMEISAKLKARHVQIHVFHAKPNGIPSCHKY